MCEVVKKFYSVLWNYHIEDIVHNAHWNSNLLDFNISEDQMVKDEYIS